MTQTVRASLDIIHEDDSILVVNKPGGIATQAPRQFDSLESRVRQHLLTQSPAGRTPYLGIPHRLDRCVSGVIVFAKRIKAAQRLSKQFERRQIKKRYTAWVVGRVTDLSGQWRDWLRKIPNEPRAEVTSENEPGARVAVLNFLVEDRTVVASKLSIQLETGRMHQIRVQAASRGFPIVGDTFYGSQIAFGPKVQSERDRCIALHAAELIFCHPRSREEVEFRAAPPDSWSGLPDI